MFCIRSSLFYVLALFTFSNAFQLLTPNTTAPFEPTDVFYKRHDDDPQSWSLNVSKYDGTEAAVLQDGIFTPNKRGVITVKIPRHGSLILTAVNSSNLFEAYNSTDVFLSVDPGSQTDDVASSPTSNGAINSPPGNGPENSIPLSPPSATDQSPVSSDSTSTGSSSLGKSPKTVIIVSTVVGAVVVLLIILAAAIFLYRRSARSRPTTFYRERMVRPRDPEPSSPTSSFAVLVSRSPPQFYYGEQVREKVDEESSVASYSVAHEKR